MPRTLIQSLFGNAISLNGTNGNAVRRSLISNSQGDYTACCWINLSGTPSSTTTLIKNGETGNGNGGWKFSVTTASKLNLSDPGGGWGGTASTALSNSTWYHVAFIKASNVTQMYINAVADGSTIAGTFNAPQTDTTVGATHNTTSSTYTNVFNGLIDDARIYTRAISTTELTQLYNFYLNPNNPFGDIPTTNLLMLYKMDESTGASTVADSSPAGNTGTVIGSPTFATGNVYISNIPSRTSAGTRTAAGTRTLVI